MAIRYLITYLIYLIAFFNFVHPITAQVTDSILVLKIRSTAKKKRLLSIGIKYGVAISESLGPSADMSSYFMNGVKYSYSYQTNNSNLFRGYSLSSINGFLTCDNVGVFVNRGISNYFSLQSELIYYSQAFGFDYKLDLDQSYPGSIDLYHKATIESRELYKINFLALPLIFKSTANWVKFKPYFSIGIAPVIPLFGRRITNNKSYDGTSSFADTLSSSDVYCYDRKKNISVYPFSLNILCAIGNQIKLNKKISISMEARWSSGITSTTVRDGNYKIKENFVNYYLNLGMVYNINFENTSIQSNKRLEKKMREHAYLIQGRDFKFNHIFITSAYLRGGSSVEKKYGDDLIVPMRTQSFWFGLKYVRSFKKNLGVFVSGKIGILNSFTKSIVAGNNSGPGFRLSGLDLSITPFYQINIAPKWIYSVSLAPHLWVETDQIIYFNQSNTFSFRFKNNQLLQAGILFIYYPKKILLGTAGDYYAGKTEVADVYLKHLAIGIELCYSFLNFNQIKKKKDK